MGRRRDSAERRSLPVRDGDGAPGLTKPHFPLFDQTSKQRVNCVELIVAQQLLGNRNPAMIQLSAVQRENVAAQSGGKKPLQQ